MSRRRLNNGGLFGLEESHSGLPSRVACKNTIYDRQSDFGEICSKLDACIFII